MTRYKVPYPGGWYWLNEPPSRGLIWRIRLAFVISFAYIAWPLWLVLALAGVAKWMQP